MYRTSHLDVEGIVCFDETLPHFLPFSKARPVPVHEAYFYLDRRQQLGEPVTFRTKGLDAKEAIEEIKKILEEPIEKLEREIQQITGMPALWYRMLHD